MGWCDLLVVVGILCDCFGWVLFVGNDWQGYGWVCYIFFGGVVEYGEMFFEVFYCEIYEEIGLKFIGIKYMVYMVYIEDECWGECVIVVVFEVIWEGLFNFVDFDGFIVEVCFCMVDEVFDKFDLLFMCELFVDYFNMGELGCFYVFKGWDGCGGLCILMFKLVVKDCQCFKVGQIVGLVFCLVCLFVFWCCLFV